MSHSFLKNIRIFLSLYWVFNPYFFLITLLGFSSHSLGWIGFLWYEILDILREGSYFFFFDFLPFFPPTSYPYILCCISKHFYLKLKMQVTSIVPWNPLCIYRCIYTYVQYYFFYRALLYNLICSKQSLLYIVFFGKAAQIHILNMLL